MPRFCIHVIDQTGTAIDEEGIVLLNEGEAREEAIQGIRSFLSHDVLEGVMDLRGRAEVFDDKGNLIYVVRFDNAVEVRTGGADDDRTPSKPPAGP